MNLLAKLFTDTRFEAIWVAENVDNKYGAGKKTLTDEEYIDYKIWEDANCIKMHKKHIPGTRVMRGKNPNIIFHGGCLGCKSQRIHGIDRCKGCQYFKAEWNKPDLSIEGEESDTMSGEDLMNFLGNNPEDND